MESEGDDEGSTSVTSFTSIPKPRGDLDDLNRPRHSTSESRQIHFRIQSLALEQM